MIKDWKIKSIEEIAKTTSGGTPSRTNKSYYTGNILWVKSGELDDNFISETEEYITEEAVKNSSAKIFPVGTVLMAMYGATVGKTAILKVPATTNQAVCGIIPKPAECNNEFLRFQLMFKREDFLKQRYGGAQPNISQTIIKTFDILLPPLPEQRKITYILSTVQKAIEQQDKLIRHTTELKKALMQKLFTEGTKGEKQKETEIGLVPESWEVKPLIDAVEFIDYGVSQAIPKTPPPNGVKIVSTADINRAGDLLYEKIRTIEVPKRTAEKLELKDGDLLFNWRNSAELIGKSTIYHQQSEPHIFASFILRINCGEKKSHNYFMKYLMNHYREEGVFIKLSRRAVNQANYNRNEISVLPIPLPPYKEQVAIANIITKIENKINHQKSKKQTLTDLFNSLLHNLMTGERRVHEIEFEALSKAYKIVEQPLSIAAEK
ncbi:MAG: restriction endonuclease subunit S [Draconibacterium sp.]